MAKRIVSVTSITPTATADTVNLVDSASVVGYPCVIQPGSTTQRVQVLEVMETGLAGASSPTIMLLARDSQVGTGSNTRDTNQTDSNLDANTAALAAPVLTGNKFATNKPQRGVNDHLLNLGFNAFGGIVRWNAAPGQEITVYGTAALIGEVSLSAFTGGTPGLLGAHVIYEPY
jgi:hypothetical protein